LFVFCFVLERGYELQSRLIGAKKKDMVHGRS